MKIEYDISDIPDKKIFIEMLTYISEYIQKIEPSSDEKIVSIICEDSFKDEVFEKIESLKDMITKKITNKETSLEIKTIEDFSNNETLCKTEIFEELLKSKSIYSLSDGSYAYGNLFLKIYKYFDKKIEEYGFLTFKENDIQEQTMPVLYSVDGYEEGGYFETFPHHIMFESVLKNDIDVINIFSKNGLKDRSIFSDIKTPDNVLRTATCAPVYKYLQNKIIDSSKPEVFLVSGRCFRNEGANVKTLERLKEFYMKEYVVVGTANQIDDFMTKAHRIWNFWIDTFDLNCKIETANDSFFANNYKKLKLFQLLGQSKQEFRLLIPGTNNYISCGSANFHRTHFSKRYSIFNNNEKQLSNSACFAFGVDRLTYAFLSQKGLDVSKWDEKTISEISKYINL